MEERTPTQERIDELNAAFRGLCDVFQPIIKNVIEAWDNLVIVLKDCPTIQLLMEKPKKEQYNKQHHEFIGYTKGKMFKSQVQLNKPKFIQARSRL